MKNRRWIDAAAGAVVLVVLVLLIGRYNRLPDLVPTHFSFAGVADSLGPRHLLWIMAGLMVLSHAGLTLLAARPNWFNYPVEITEQNKSRQQQNMVRFTTRARLVVVALVGLPIIQSTNLALGVRVDFFPLAILSLGLILLALVGYHLFQAFRLA